MGHVKLGFSVRMLGKFVLIVSLFCCFNVVLYF